MSPYFRNRGAAIGGVAVVALACAGLVAWDGGTLPGLGQTFELEAAMAAETGLGMDFDTYAAKCLEELEGGKAITIPPFLQCTDGAILPIKRNGHELPAQSASNSGNFTSATTCDRPPILDISGGGIGQCVPNSRLQVSRADQTGVDLKDRPYYALLCRNYKYRSLDAEKVKAEYDDVAMIVHSPVTSKTCFFQRLADTNLFAFPYQDSAFAPVSAISGADVPSPFGDKGKTFWEKPEKVKDINCARCHDANPFVRTPYVHQVTTSHNALPPRKPGQAYGIGQLDYFGQAWKEYHAYFNLAPTDKGKPGACVSCHSLGPGFSSGNFTRYSAGEPAPGQLVTGQFRDSHWMPPGASAKDWQADYEAAVEALKRCNATPGGIGCNKTDLH